MKNTLALLLSASLLSGCSYGFRGPTPVLGPRAVIATDQDGPRTGFYFERFRALALQAAGCTSSAPNASAIQCNPADTPSPALLRRYMRAGFALIYADCDQYLSVMSRHQRRSGIARDLIAPVAALITGIISLRNFDDEGEQDLLTGLSLATGATTSALDIVDQRFLFGSDNIDAVREMVSNALGAQADGALNRDDDQLSFERASSEILNNQAICRPSGILRLTRNAIQNAAMVPRDGEPSQQHPQQPQQLVPPPPPPPPPPPVESRAGMSTTSVDVRQPQ